MTNSRVTALSARVPRGPALEHTPAPGRLLLTVEQAADRLRVSRTTMYHLLQTGQVRSVRIGRSRRVPEVALAAYVERLMAGGSDDAA